ncbi:MAG: type VI secretion system tip protein VgrG, partial [Deltaproteobacteria bacterium]|nr:type VI secretion system tip protein VgrG [Deltaproteobacteria bacterium]
RMGDRTFRRNLDLDGVTANELEVIGAVVREELFGTYRVEVELQTSIDVDVEALLGTPAALRLEIDGSTERCFHGVVTEAETDAPERGHELRRVHVVIEPKVALLALGRDSRIWQDKSIPDVVKDVLAQAGIPEDSTSWNLSGAYDPHPNIVQYSESDWAFVLRLLHEEGIGFAIHNDEASATVVFFDDVTTLGSIGGPTTTLTARSATRAESDVIEDLQMIHAGASDAAMIRDYDPRRPNSHPEAESKLGETAQREVYMHPGGFLEAAAGQQRVERLLDRLQLRVRTFRGRTDNPFVEPGRAFAVELHPCDAMNAELRVLSVVHRVSNDPTREYEAEIEAIPATTPYRSLEAPSPPRIGGVHFGVITCAPGEEIHTDDLGRSKVRFHWDRSGLTDDRSSTWLRVGQLPLPGSMLLPRIDFEVVVDYELGDIDRPFCSLHLYNGEHRAPYDLPAGNVCSSFQTGTTGGGGGANEVRMTDTAGGEEMFFNASKDLTVSIENDSEVGVGVDETVEVGSNHQLRVGTDYTQKVTGARSLTVGANQSINVGTDLALSCGVDESCTVGAMRKVNAGGDHQENTKVDMTRKVGAVQALVAINGQQRKIGGSATNKVGAAWVEITTAARALSAKNYFETVGALKLIKAKSIAQSAGAAYGIQCAAFDVKVGGDMSITAGAALSLAAAGGIDVKSENVVISGDSKLNFKAGGCSIEMTPTSVTLKASSKIDLRGAKGISNALHKSA